MSSQSEVGFKPIRLVTVAAGDRHAATARIRDAFNESGAWITDVHFFSGVQTAFAFEVAVERLDALVGALAARGMTVDAAGAASIREAIAEASGDLGGTLVVMFVDGDPDLAHDVPAIPG